MGVVGFFMEMYLNLVEVKLDGLNVVLLNWMGVLLEIFVMFDQVVKCNLFLENDFN